VIHTLGHTVGTLNKQNKTKQNKTVEEAEQEKSAAADEVMIFYLNNINPMITPSEAEDIEYYERQLPKDLLLFAMQKAVDQKARKMAYIKSILDKWIAKGITTLSEAKGEKKPQPKNESLHRYYDSDNEVIDIRKYYDYLD
jgi:DnaD/phage-associated family protein